MGAAVEQEIRVKIKALVDNLKSVQELQSAVKSLQSQGSKKLGVSADTAGGSKFLDLLRQLSPEAEAAVGRVEGLSESIGLKLSPALLGAVGALGAAGAAFTGGEVLLFKLAQGAAEAANRVGELSDQTGLSVETLSAVGTAAEQNHSSLEDFATSVGFLEKKISDAASGSKQAHDDLVRLGIEPKKAVGDLDYAVGQAFKTINDYKGTAHAAGLATDAFGRSGKALITTITSVNGSLDEAKRQAAELGTLLSREAVDAARRFDDQMDQLGLRVKGLAYATGTQLVPAMTQLVTALNSLLGAAKPEITLFFEGLAGQVKYFANQIAVAAAAIEAFNGSGGTWTERFQASLSKYFAAASADPSKPPPANPPGGGGGRKGGGGKSARERAADALREVFKSEDDVESAARDARSASLSDSLDREKQLITAQLEARLISYREYYTKLAQIETDSIDQEILRQQEALTRIDDDLRRKRNELAADKKLTAGERVLKETAAANEAAAKAAPVLEKINELERERAGVVGRVRAEAIKTTEEYQRQLSAVRGELQALTGEGVEAAKREIDERFRELRERAAADGDQAAVAIIDALTRRLKQRAQFDALEQQLRDVFQRIRDAEDAIDAEERVGHISPDEAEHRKLEVARAQRAELERLHGELKGIAEATKDPELLSAVNRLGVEIAQVGVEVDHLAQDLNRDLKAALDDTLFAIIRRKDSVKGAITELANHILDELARLASSAIVDQLFGEHGIFGGVFGGQGGQGGVGGILSGIFRPRQGTNPQAPQGSTSVLDTLPGVIKNFQGSATSGLRDVNTSTKGVSGEVSSGIQTVDSRLTEIITFLPNLLPAEQPWWKSALLGAVGLAATALNAKVAAKFGRGGGGTEDGDGDSGGHMPFAFGRGYSGGGGVDGPGTSTSDSIRARLSKGEFVMRAAAVRSIGADVLDYMNRLGRLPAFDLPGYAAGGALEGVTPPARLGGDDITVNVPVTIQTPSPQAFKDSEQAIMKKLARATEQGVRRAKTRKG